MGSITYFFYLDPTLELKIKNLTILVGIHKILLSSLNMCIESCALQLAVATQ